MRRFLIVFIAFCATITWLVPAQQPAATQPGSFTLSVDSIMRGPKLIGSAPTAVRWAPDSSKIYFSWQKPGEDRAQTYSVNKDGSDLHQLTAEEVRQIPAAPTGRYDRTKKRLLTAENGNIVIYDVATNARRELMRTASIESNPRWVRNDTAVTFMRDGNLFLMSLDASVEVPYGDSVDRCGRAGRRDGDCTAAAGPRAPLAQQAHAAGVRAVRKARAGAGPRRRRPIRSACSSRKR